MLFRCLACWLGVSVAALELVVVFLLFSLLVRCLLVPQCWYSFGWCFRVSFRCLVCWLGVSLAALYWCSAGSVSVCCFFV